MTASKRTAIAAILLFATGAGSALPGEENLVQNAQASQNGQAYAQTGIEGVVRRHYTEAFPYSEIHRFGPSAAPQLAAMLGDPAEREYWSNIASAIGIVGGPNAAETLIGFVDANSGRTLDGNAYRAALAAVMALGLVANGGDMQALNYLLAAARRMSEASTPAADLRLEPSAVGVQAILGLGLSAKPEARAFLEDLTRSSDAQLRERAAEALRVNRIVSRTGLAAYFARR